MYVKLLLLFQKMNFVYNLIPNEVQRPYEFTGFPTALE